MNVGFVYNNNEFQAELANYIYSNKDINESLLSKVLSELTVKNIIIQVMKNKKDFSKLDRKERKKYDVDGRISFFKVAPPIEKIKEVLSNPYAVKFINSSLKKTNLFKIFLKLAIKSYIYLIYNEDEETNQLIKSFVYSSIAKNNENNFSDDYDSFIKNIRNAKLKDNDIEDISEYICNDIVNNNTIDIPLALFFPYSLTEDEI